jgi:hypothetical protein
MQGTLTEGKDRLTTIDLRQLVLLKRKKTVLKVADLSY